MTPVEFHFISPTGEPIADTPFEIQLSKAGFDVDDSGIIMPRRVDGLTDADGKQTISLWPSLSLYHVEIYDKLSEAALHYTFYVPSIEVGAPTVRLQDIVIATPMSTIPYDEAALLAIHDAKANTLAAHAASVVAKTASELAQVASEAALAAIIPLEASTVSAAAAGLVSEANTEANAAAALASELAAKASEDVSEASQVDSADSAAAALASELAAKQSELLAKDSETAANLSKLAALGSETTASAAATLAVAKADIAVAAEVVASAAAVEATTGATTATTQAGISTTKADAAAVSEGTATAKALIATNKAADAAASELAAASSATTALASETAAGVSETNALASATSASDDAADAAASAASAASAKTAAEDAAASAATLYDNFDDRYLGAKSSNPSVDNHGAALLTGALYFNSASGEMHVYNGSAWVSAYVSTTGLLSAANNLSDLANAATARSNLGLVIGADVQEYDATLLKAADIGNAVQAYDAQTAKYNAATPNFTGDLQVGGVSVGTKIVPQNSQSAAYTCVLTDSGKHLLHPSADTTARTFTIPANSSVPYPIGTAITFVNQNGAGTVTIAITSDTMRLAGAGTTGNRTLAANGIATALKITSTEWVISGSGLT